MNFSDLIRGGLRFHWRSHLGVVLGAAVAAAVLVGALAVGDSVRRTLTDKAAARLPFGRGLALHPSDRFFGKDLGDRIYRNTVMKRGAHRSGMGSFLWPTNPFPTLLQLPAMVRRGDGTALANRIHVYGVDAGNYIGGPTNDTDTAAGLTSIEIVGEKVWLNEALTRQLNVKAGDDVILRIHKPSVISRDAILTPRDETSIALRLPVGGVLSKALGGNYSLEASQVEPLNAFVPYTLLAKAAGLEGRANVLMGKEPIYVPDAREWAVFLGSALQQYGYPRLAHFLWRSFPKSQTRRSGEASLHLDTQIRSAWDLGDAELSVTGPSDPRRSANNSAQWVELATHRIFLEPAVVAAAPTNEVVRKNDPLLPKPVPILTYLVNSVRHADRLTPYSMVTAAPAPYTPVGMHEDEIVVNEWLAEDLGVKPGDSLSLSYYRADAGSQLIEQTNRFRVHSIVPLSGLTDDPTLMPEFPGLSKAESTHDWDAGFELVHKIRDKDEAYWKAHRGTPKAFVTLAAGQKMWANRFGNLTAIRWFTTGGPVAPGSRIESKTWGASEARESISTKIHDRLDPSAVGLQFEDVGEQARNAAANGQDFGGLFIGFSFFLVVSSLLLTAMLFRFGLEQRAQEIGTLLAVGWPVQRVRRLFLREGIWLAILGAILGAVGGAWYGRAVIYGLNTLWKDAVAGAGLEFYLTPGAVVGGVFGSVLIAAVTLWFTLRSAMARPARELLNEGFLEMRHLAGVANGSPRHLPPFGAGARPDAGRETRCPSSRIQRASSFVGTSLPAITAGLALVLVAFSKQAPESARAGMFFGVGALALISGLLWIRRGLRNASAARSRLFTATSLARRAVTRRPGRSLTTIALLASATFLIIAVAANRLDSTRDATLRSSGTGGFALWAESTLPVLQDLNTQKGREFYGLNAGPLAGVTVVPLRVRDGDEASCLNLNRAQRPRLLGIKPGEMSARGAFVFAGLAAGITVTNGWQAMGTSGFPGPSARGESDVVPVIGDAASIQWALGKKLGDTLEYVDERGKPFRVRLVGAVGNSILQGSLLMDAAEFTHRFPGESGHRAFLIDAPVGSEAVVGAELSRALGDLGFEVTRATDRLDRFNAVQNTYLKTFQVLGGLGLLLGSIGLGIVVLRNVYERRGELGVLAALGFSPFAVRSMVLREHAWLLVLGLIVGTGAALPAVLPVVELSAAGFPWGSMALTLLAVLLNGLFWTWLATRRACSGSPLAALRGE
ncbi:MAG: ABC transporter permease [Pedosphaera sp.]|nr:ABC transporter permease [Pedosphaera sp.]